jgi:hypothetical protein
MRTREGRLLRLNGRQRNWADNIIVIVQRSDRVGEGKTRGRYNEASDVGASAKPAAKPAEKPAATAKPAAEPAAKPLKTAKAAPVGKPMSAWRRAYIAKHHHEPPVKAK